MKTKPILLTIALFIAINVAVHGMTSAYEHEAISLMSSFSGQEYVAVSENPTADAIKMQISHSTIDGRTVLLVSIEDLSGFLKANGAWVLGDPPAANNEVMVGEELRSLVANGILKIEGQRLKVTGYLQSESLGYTVLAVADIFPNSQVFYISSREGTGVEVSAPAAEEVARSAFTEVLAITGLASYVLYGALALSCLFQGYNSLTEAEQVMEVFAQVGAAKKMVNISMFGYAFIVSLVGTILGFVLGIFLPGFASSLISIFFKLPHLKPLVNAYVGLDLIFGFSSSLLALTAGLLGGYSRQVAAV